MRDVILYMSMSVDGFVDSDREHPGVAIAEGAELKQWKLDRISKAGAHLMGRVTYQQMSSYWPQSDDPYAAGREGGYGVGEGSIGRRCVAATRERGRQEDAGCRPGPSQMIEPPITG